ncbi:MAG: serine/threonine-protein kinase [Planctomycetota bacterium]
MNQDSESADNSQPEPPDMTGVELGDYLLLRRLGRGGMADVYLAEQGSLKRKVAFKILKPDLARDKSYVQRFRQEAQAAAGLIQSNIVQIYEVGECDGFHFISQEYIQGRNLGQYLARFGAVEQVLAINVLRQSALALQEAGKENVIHRDIKPENIMLSTKGEVKITDFGLARIQNNKSDQALTQIGVTMGTPLYMSPEQVEGHSLDQRSDIYSLGVTAYHMLAGEPPFSGDNALTIALQHVKDDPIPLDEIRPDIVPELCQIVARMMAKKREDRPADASALIQELRKLKVDLDDDFESIVEKLAVNESGSQSIYHSTSVTEAKLAATRQLQQVIRGSMPSWWMRRTTWLMFAALALAGFVGGTITARQTPPPSLLKLTSETRIPKKESAKAQYEAAQFDAAYLFADDPQKQEQYFKAVNEYFPVDAQSDVYTVRFNRLAKARLAEIYIMRNSFDQAEEIFDEFITLDGQMVNEFKVIGYAGKAIVLTESNPVSEIDKKAVFEEIGTAINKVSKLGVDQLNEFMAGRFQQAIDQFNQKNNELMSQNID